MYILVHMSSDTITEEGTEYTMSTSFRERHKNKKWTKDDEVL